MPNDPEQGQSGGNAPEGNEGQPQGGTSEGGSNTPEWLGLIPEGIRGEASLQTIKDVGALAQGYVHAQKLIGSSIRLPKEGDSPEDALKFRNDTYDKLGRPKTIEEYNAAIPDLPEGITWDETAGREFFEVAHKHGMNTDQVQAVMDFYGRHLATASGQTHQLFEQGMESLRGEWGAATERNVETAARAIKVMGGDDALAKFEASGLGNDPNIVQMFHAIGKALQEDGIILPEDGISDTSSLQSELSSLVNSDAYLKGDHAGHDAAVNRAFEINQILAG